MTRYSGFTDEVSPAGTALTPANTGLSFVTPNTGAITSDQTHALSGSYSAKIVPVASVASLLGRYVTGNSVAARIPFWLDTLPTADHWAVAAYNNTTRLAMIHWNSAGKSRLDNASGSAGVATDPNAFPTGKWAFLNLFAQAGTTGADGKLRGTVDLGDASAPVWDSGMLVNQNVGTIGSFTSVQFGKVNQGAYVAPMWVDLNGVVIDDAATDIVYPIANQAPVAAAGGSQTVEAYQLVTVNGSGSSDADGTIASYAWRQVSGPAVTLAGSGASRTFSAPASMAGATVVLGLTVTDNGGAVSTESTVTLTVLPATEASAKSGAWTPFQTLVSW